jgi:hypothetical protein
VYRSGPPRTDDAGRPSPARLRVRRVADLVFDGDSKASCDPDLRVYLADAVRPYQLALREDLLQEGAGHSYGEMAEELIRATVPEDEPIDLLVLAFSVPDVRPGRSTALYLSHVCPGRPMALAVCDQGAAAAHTALRLAREYGRDGSCRRALVIVVEQTTVHYELPVLTPAVPATLPSQHVAVAVICDQSGTEEGVTVGQHADIGPESVGDRLNAAIAESAEDRARTVVILGGGLADIAAAVDAASCRQIIQASARQPFTGQWSELARGLPDWSAEGALVLLADYDSQLRCLSCTTIDLGPGPTS